MVSAFFDGYSGHGNHPVIQHSDGVFILVYDARSMWDDIGPPEIGKVDDTPIRLFGCGNNRRNLPSGSSWCRNNNRMAIYIAEGTFLTKEQELSLISEIINDMI